MDVWGREEADAGFFFRSGEANEEDVYGRVQVSIG